MPGPTHHNEHEFLMSIVTALEQASSSASDVAGLKLRVKNALIALGLGSGSGNVTGPAGATNNHLAVFNGATGLIIKDGGAVPTGDVVGPAGAVSGNLAVFDGVTGKLIKDGGAPSALGALTLIQTQIVTVDTTTVSFVGLAGNTDAEYMLRGKIITGAVGGGLVIQPNGLGTNLKSGQMSSSSGGVFGGSTTTFRFGNPGANVPVGFTMNIHAKKNANGVASVLTFDCIAHEFDGGGNGNVFASAGQWTETVTELIQIDIVSEVATQILNGSYFNLYKFAQ